MLSLIRRLRLERGWKQVDLAKVSGIHQERISLLERGMPPTREEAESLAKIFGIEVNEIIRDYRNLVSSLDK